MTKLIIIAITGIIIFATMTIHNFGSKMQDTRADQYSMAISHLTR